MKIIFKILLKKQLDKVVMPVKSHYFGDEATQLKNKFFYKGISIYPFRNYRGDADYENDQIVFNNNVHYIRDYSAKNRLYISYKLTFNTYKKISKYIKCNMEKR